MCILVNSAYWFGILVSWKFRVEKDFQIVEFLWNPFAQIKFLRKSKMVKLYNLGTPLLSSHTHSPLNYFFGPVYKSITSIKLADLIYHHHFVDKLRFSEVMWLDPESLIKVVKPDLDLVF